MREFRYFTVRPRPQSPSRMTVDYDVVSRHGDTLGALAFFPAWRQHVLVPAEGSVWSTGCLLDICEALAEVKGRNRPVSDQASATGGGR